MRKTNRLAAACMAAVLAFTPAVSSVLSPAAVVMAATTDAKPTRSDINYVEKSTADGVNTVKLFWNKADNTTTYRIYYKEIGGSWELIKSVGSAKVSASVSSTSAHPIKDGVSYLFTVRTYNKNSGKWGKWDQNGTLVQFDAPSVPTQASITSAGTSVKNGVNKVTLTWNSASNATHYKVYYKPAGGSWQRLKTLISDKNSFAVSDTSAHPIKDGVTYLFTVRSYNNVSGKYGPWDKNGTAVRFEEEAVPKAQSVTVNPNARTLTGTGKTLQLYADVRPAGASQSVTWKSSNTSVASVSGTGLVRSVGTGSAVITATAADGSGVQGTAVITVAADKPASTPTPAPNTPTPTPKPQESTKVSAVTVNKTAVEMTKKGETVQLTASVQPAGASYDGFTWRSTDTGVATVDSNGLVTAVSTGTTTITVKAKTGYATQAQASCVVNVKLPTVTSYSLAGGDSRMFSLAARHVDASISLRDVKIETAGYSDDLAEFSWNYDEASNLITIRVKGYRKGNFQVFATYNGTILKAWDITITSDFTDYFEYVAWRKNVEAQIWNSGMSLVQKLDAAKVYIQTNFKYKNGSPREVYAFKQGVADCATASAFMGDFAKDLSCDVLFVSMGDWQRYETVSEALSYGGGHIYTIVYVNGEWTAYDAQPSIYNT